MNHPLILQIVLWTWLVLALASLGFCVFAATQIFEEDDASFNSVFLLGANAVIALCFGSLTLLGHAFTALWLWRISGVIALTTALILLFRNLRLYRQILVRQVEPSPPITTKPDTKPWQSVALAASTLLTALLTVAGFFIKQAQTLPIPNIPLTAPPLPAPPASLASTAELTLLALATLLFAALFIRETRQSGPPSFETFATGLGGDASGWQVSSSLTYLLLTILFASFFVTLATYLAPHPKSADATAATAATGTGASPTTEAKPPEIKSSPPSTNTTVTKPPENTSAPKPAE